MSQATKTANRPAAKTNPRVGLAFAFMFFAFTTLLLFLPSYFGSWTNGIAITLFIIGIIGVGSELNNLSSGKATILDGFEKGKGIFDNLGFGLACIITWIAIYYFFNNIIVNILISFILLFGVYGMFLGGITWIVNNYINKRDLEEKRIRIEAEPQKKEDLVTYNSEKYRQSLTNTINIISIVFSIVASIVAVLTFLDQVGIVNVIPNN
jgi:hypothetical protein